MSASRVEIGRALDVIASDEGGMPFQELAVVLAKKRWPDLVACTRKKDLGLDAYASAAASTLGKGMGLCCSITGTLQKLQKDAKRAAPHFEDLSVLVYATSNDVTNLTAEPWKKEIKDVYGWELIVMPREDIITTLDVPLADLYVVLVPCDRVLHDLAVYTFIAAELVALRPRLQIEEIAEKLECVVLPSRRRPAFPAR